MSNAVVIPRVYQMKLVTHDVLSELVSDLFVGNAILSTSAFNWEQGELCSFEKFEKASVDR